MRNPLAALARRMIPAPIRAALKREVRAARYAGTARLCPLCARRFRQFAPFDYFGTRRMDAQCPACGSLERQRMIWLFLERHTDIADGRRKHVLHIAPEPCLTNRLVRLRNLSYLSGDIASPLAMEKMDITAIRHPADSFDAILVSHVIQHIPDEAKAMSELFRVLKPGGWGVFVENIRGTVTTEDPAAGTPEARRQVFGDSTYVRRYGQDLPQRLARHGFEARLEHFRAEFSAADIQRFGLGSEQYICLASKPSGPRAGTT